MKETGVKDSQIPLSKVVLGKLERQLRAVRRALFPSMVVTRVPVLRSARKQLKAMARLRYLDDVHGHRMYLDAQDSLDLSWSREYEPCETRFCLSRLREGDVVLDIGANIGYYTVLFARRVGPSGHVFAFEPEPNNFALLTKNVQMNGYTNVTLVNKAVSNTNGRLRLFISQGNNADHRVYDSQDGRDCVEVESVRVDDYLADFTRSINFIKMDIQGAVYSAAQGMTSLLRKNPDIVLVTEFWPLGILRAGSEPRAFLELLRDLGFAMYWIDEDEQRIEKASIEALLDAYTPKRVYLPTETGLPASQTNLICTRGELEVGSGRGERRLQRT